ncbi:MAG TPA: hypothetical protein VN912_01515, partial [Candidatus Angelobacter sp.]|nr:hypothetical protein [Candidatus Angelobacter sp.]
MLRLIGPSFEMSLELTGRLVTTWLTFALPPAEMAARRTEGTAGHELSLMSDDLNADDSTFVPPCCWGLKLASAERPLELDFRIPRAQLA